MVKKMNFPKDWSKLPEDNVRKNVEYLCEHYKKYKVTVLPSNKIQIGDVIIESKDLRTDDGPYTHYIINGQAFPCDSKIGKELSFLFSDCCWYARPLKEKAKEWWNFNGSLVSALLILGALVGGGVEFAKLDLKKQKTIRSKLYERKKEIPNYLEHEAALKAYEDSLNNTISMWPWKNKEK